MVLTRIDMVTLVKAHEVQAHAEGRIQSIAANLAASAGNGVPEVDAAPDDTWTLDNAVREAIDEYAQAYRQAVRQLYS